MRWKDVLFALLVVVVLGTGVGSCRQSAAAEGGLGGTASTGPRIVNGAIAMNDQFQFYALVQKTTGDHCGGALITNTTVVTAAHCIEKRDGNGNLLNLRRLLSTVRIGCSGISDRPGTRWCEERRVAAVRVHPDWDGYLGAQEKDIALLTLDAPTNRVRPVKLADSAQPLERADVMGFGNSGLDGLNGLLLYTNQVIESIDGSSLITVADVAGPCYGDSGSPLVTDRGLVGLVSYGTGACDSLQDTDGYFYVPSVRSWVDLMKDTVPPSGGGSGDTTTDEPTDRPPTIESSPDTNPGNPTLELEDGVYGLQVASYGPCRGRFLAVSVRSDSCGDRTLRLYSSSTVKAKRPSKKDKDKNKKKDKDKKKDKNKNKKKDKKKDKNKNKNKNKKKGSRSLLASAPSPVPSTLSAKYHKAALWKVVTKPSDNTVYLESAARTTCVSPFVQMTGRGSTTLGPINQGWILEKAGSKYVRLVNANTYQYMKTFTKNCGLKSNAAWDTDGAAIKFRIVAG